MQNAKVPSPRFETTAWTVVLNAGLDSSETRETFAYLYNSYSYPLYVYLRKKAMDPDQAEELVQAFFVWLLEKGVVHKADPNRGRFRNFLLKSLGNFLKDRQKFENAAKRRPDQALVSINAADAESRFVAHPVHEITAERLFERAWARRVLEQAMSTLCSECRFRVDGPCAICLNGCLTGDFDGNMQQAAEKLQLSEGAARVALHRLRKRFGQILRNEVAQTVGDSSLVDDELRSLMDLVSGE